MPWGRGGTAGTEQQAAPQGQTDTCTLPAVPSSPPSPYFGPLGDMPALPAQTHCSSSYKTPHPPPFLPPDLRSGCDKTKRRAQGTERAPASAPRGDTEGTRTPRRPPPLWEPPPPAPLLWGHSLLFHPISRLNEAPLRHAAAAPAVPAELRASGQGKSFPSAPLRSPISTPPT